MFKRSLACFLLLVSLASLFGGCTDKTEPEASIPPGITKPEGRIVSTDPKAIEGRVTKLTDKKIWVSVQGVDWELTLNEDARFAIKKLAEHDIVIEKGTFVVVYYDVDEKDNRTATRIERLRVN